MYRLGEKLAWRREASTYCVISYPSCADAMEVTGTKASGRGLEAKLDVKLVGELFDWRVVKSAAEGDVACAGAC